MAERIPANIQYVQNNQGDRLGDIQHTFNIDLSNNRGKVRVSPRTKITTDDITNLGIACNFVRFNAGTIGFYTIAGTRVFNTAGVDPELAFADSSTGNTGGSNDVSDIIHFKAANMLVASQGGSFSSVIYYNGSWNSTNVLSLTNGTPHMWCEYANRLYVTENYKKVLSLSTSITTGEATSGTNSFNLGTLDANNVGLRIIDVLSASDGIWLLTQTAQFGEPAIIYKWDGVTADSPKNKYILDCGGVVAGIMKDDTLFILTVEGELLFNSGSTFSRVPNGKLPVNSAKYLKNSFSTVNDRWIHPRGITLTDEGKINILINNEYEDGTIEERLPSGIWEYDFEHPELGWQHIASLSLYTDSVIDYGQIRISRVGALKYVKTPNKNGQFLVGAQLYTDASTTKEVILTNNSNDTLQKFGYFVTSNIYSKAITDEWIKVWARFKKLLNSNDFISIRYRTNEEDPTEATITWTSGTTFTTTTNVSAYEGFEVEVIQGKGSGLNAKITDVSESGGTYTVTVDTTFPVTSGTSKARFQKWYTAGVKYNKQTERYMDFAIGEPSTEIQIKTNLMFQGKDELDDLTLINKSRQLAD